MASKIVIFTLAVSICKVQSQVIACNSNSPPVSSSKLQSSLGCGPSQPQAIRIQPSNSNKGLKASPQLQIVPGQSLNLQMLPLSALLAQSPGSNLPKVQTGLNAPRLNVQASPVPQIPSSPAQCVQPPSCNPSVITAPVSTITMPPGGVNTVIDHTLCNCLAYALQLLIAENLINTAASNNIINQDCISIPAPETCVPVLDLSCVKKSDDNQINGQECQTCQSGPATGCSRPYNYPDQPSYCDWERLLERLCEDPCGTGVQTQGKPTDSDWTAVLDYLNSQNYNRNYDRSYDRSCDSAAAIEIEPQNSNYDYNSFINYLRQNGQTAAQIASQSCQPIQPNCDTIQNYNPQGAYIPSSQSSDADRAILEALVARLGGAGTGPNIVDVVFPDEIPAQLICNYGYLPATVPVVTFSVQPESGCNIIVGNKC